ncbi:MAG: DUF3419 family protein [Pseudomonadota bacterium]
MPANHTDQREDWILYSTCDEDADSELSALGVSNDDDVLCITGSACRTLSLVSRNPSSITSVDYAAGQNYLLELKLVAIRTLEYGNLLEFLGVEPARRKRRDTYSRLETQLSEQARRYFRRHIKEIDAGILFRGRHEKFYIRFLAPLLRLLYGKALDAIFSARTIAEQKEIYFNRIRGPFFKILVTKGFNKALLTTVLNNPNYEVEVEIGNLGNYMLDTLDHTFSTHLARSSDWLSLMLNGKYLGRDALPHFLREETVGQIRRATTNVEIVTQDIVEYVKTVADLRFSKFSLSDISSCIAKARFTELLSEIPRIGRDDGRLCYRNFVARHKIPEHLHSRMRRDNELCAQLNHDDRAFSYQFEIATLRA